MPGIAEELFVHSDKLPIRLYCSICLDVAEAAIITQCDHLFCTECIEQLQTANGNNCECPNCREPILPMKPATNARNFLSQQQVYCSDMDALRCGWIGKYSMWHTHRAKYCDRASTSDKRDAKNAVSTEIGNFHKEELNTMSVGRLRKILQQYIKLNRNQLSDTDIHQTFNWKLFLEKKEYVHAIVEFQSTYGLSGQLMNHNSPSKPHTQDDDNTCTNHTQFPTTYDTLKRLKIRELSSYLRSKNIDPSSAEYACIEKSDLIKLVLETQKHYQEIINGKAYDPKLEKQQFSPPPPSSNDHTEYKEEIKEDPHPTNNQNNNNNNASSTAYHFTSDHLRRSSINRIDINQTGPNVTHSRTYYSTSSHNQPSNGNIHHHTTNINTNNYHYGPMPRTQTHHPHHAQPHHPHHAQPHHHAHAAAAGCHPYARPPPPPPPPPSFPSMPQMPSMSNVANTYAFNTMFSTMFGNPHHNNPNHPQ
eukprot:126008_1